MIPRDNRYLIFVAGNFKALSLVIVANDCHVGKLDLLITSKDPSPCLSNWLNDAPHKRMTDHCQDGVSVATRVRRQMAIDSQKEGIKVGAANAVDLNH